MNRRAVLAAITIACAAIAPPASPQPAARSPSRTPATRPLSPPAPFSEDPGALRARFGVERAKRLVRSADPDERLRGVERAASLAAEGNPESVALLIQQVDPSASTRGDARAKIAVARGLALRTDDPGARAALLQIVELAAPRASSPKSEAEDPAFVARLEIARRIAALALAQAGDAHAVEGLVAIARGTTAGSAAAVEALTAFPPSGSATWAKPMSAAMARLVAQTGDLRALGAVLDAARGTTLADAPAKAAAIDALGVLGDARVVPIALAALSDDDPHVRTAATRALVALGAPEAPRAVEMLLADDATAGWGIDLALTTHGLGIVHALAARTVIAADLAIRSAAIAALGRDPTADGTEALSALGRDPMIRADAADAIARSPSPAAMGAIERLAASPPTRRLGVRAYVVRAIVRGETSHALERTIAELARAKDGRDRALGAFAEVVLGEGAGRWLDDPDPAVRRAAAMASLRSGTSAVHAALLAHRAEEKDPATQAVLGAGLVDGDPGGAVPTHALVSCVNGGGADVPLCALALARRPSPTGGATAETLLASRDAIVRAHAARGLGGSQDPTAAVRLADAYAYEPDPLVRRAIVRALLTAPRDVPAVEDTLATAARLDPDPEIRWLGRAHPAVVTPDETSIAWIHLIDPNGAPPNVGPDGSGCQTGALLRPDGLAIPIAFDPDGDALVPGVPSGTSRLVLAPRMDAAYAPSP